MSTMLKKFSTVTALALSATLWACENAGDLTQPQLGPDVRGASFDIEASEGSEGAQQFRLLRGTDGSLGVATATIGVEGGKLEIGRHELKVPAGAVDQPTVFRIELRDDEHLVVELSAVARDSHGNVIFTGEQGFKQPVKLELSYSWAAQDFEAEQLIVVWARPDGVLEPLKTHVNEDIKEIEAHLDHFSLYGIAWPS